MNTSLLIRNHACSHVENSTSDLEFNDLLEVHVKGYIMLCMHVNLNFFFSFHTSSKKTIQL